MSFLFAAINGTNLHYQIGGEGTAVTLIHAGIAHLPMWDEQIDALSAAHRVLRYDVRGWGRTVQPEAPFSHHEDLRALLQHVGIAKTAVIGCSWGGKIALDFALTFPEMVSALVLVGPGLGGYEWTLAGIAEKVKAVIAAYEDGDKVAAAELETQIWFDGPNRTPAQVDPAIRQRAYALSLYTLALPQWTGQAQEIEPPARHRLAAVQAPTLVLVGEHDVPDVHTIAGILAAELPIVEKILIRDTAHLPNMEQPSTFNNLVLDFLEKAEWRSTIYAILPHKTQAQLWLEPTAAGFTLPHTIMAGGMWDTGEAAVQPPLQRLFGAAVQVLYRAHFQKDDVEKWAESLFVLDNERVVARNGRWVSRPELPSLQLAHPAHQPIIEQCLREWETGDIPALRPPWARPGWFQQAATWIENRLAQTEQSLIGPLEPVRQWSLSCVLRANTANGRFYFKTVAALPLFVNEAALVTKLARLYPDHLLTPLAVDQERDWMLLPEVTQIVGWSAPLTQRHGFLSRFGRLQVTAVAHVAQLLAAGCLDRRLEWLAAQIEPLLTADFLRPYLTADEQAQLQARIPRLRVLCHELAAFDIPETLVHGDLHGGNVAMRDGDFVYFDWTDACISHPFFDMLNIFMEKDTAVQTQLRDAYLGQWTDFAPMPRLLSAWSLAEVLGAVHHAISYWQILANIEPHSRHHLDTWLQWWLRRILALTPDLEAKHGG